MKVNRSGGGFDRLRKALNDLSKVSGKTGWPSSATYPDGTKVVDVAEYNEYGTTRTPPRPFVRVAIADNQTKWLKSLAEGARACLNGSTNGVAVLENTALLAAGDIAKAIKAVTTPPLKKETVNRKGFDKPLVDTGLMIQTVTGIAEPKE